MHVQTMAAVAWVALAAGLCSIAQAQGIYSCVDAAGRKITADRPIAECIDRPQREINPSGTVKRVVGPSLTAQERAAQEQKDKAAAEVRAREAEEKRRDRALLLRYPSRAVHDKERAEALDQIDVVIKAASKRTTELAGQRKAIDADFEFYKSDPARAPASLKRRLEENDSSVAVQKRFIADQDAEKKRVNMRFDEELVKLNQLWAMGGAVPAAAAVPTARK
ncbi:MAG: DUF4124 domain-containing protein [Polaromonas sp.]|uniref:DUF4124 domain-containing protein n=1 Tax=Polaromonas sp. TaxID=1869339 RepID=UPI00272417B7|nr:DUF4124 domain-containing protein [Polaromonas sp.]MDO9114473.1 DUF4124 domain-containing protein [Polaromonas sp.]MDP1888658.1 DUF4124 domain-containing protein [Polaromonas sp.]